MDAAYTGQIISAFRRQKGLTQKDLAERLNVTNKAVSKWECGKNFPDLVLLQPLADELGTTVSDLLGLEQPITEDTIAVMSAISQQEKTAIKRSLYQFIVVAMLASALYLLFRINAAEKLERWLIVLNFFVLANGGVLLQYLHLKFSARDQFRWPVNQYAVLMNNLKISVAMWGDKLRGK